MKKYCSFCGAKIKRADEKLQKYIDEVLKFIDDPTFPLVEKFVRPYMEKGTAPKALAEEIIDRVKGSGIRL